MKDIENVTAHIGEGEVLTPVEETGSAAAGGARMTEDPRARGSAAVPFAVEQADGPAARAHEMDRDPWQVLVNAGAQFAAALAAANDPAATARPSIEHDPATGARHLKMPLPGPETVRRLADAFSAIAESLRRTATSR
jgi:hypothetical protein